MESGFSARKIPIEKSFHLSGYLNRTEKSTGFLDEIFVRVCLINVKSQMAALVSIDSLAITRKTTLKWEKSLKSIYPEIKKVIFCATHTHAAPSISEYGELMILDQGYDETVFEKIKECLDEAKENLTACEISFKSVLDNEIGKNRVKVENESSVYLSGLYFWKENDDLLGGIVSYNCHPTVLSFENQKISSEFLGLALTNLEQKFKKSKFLFVNGAAGDISTRFTRKSQTYEQVKQFGIILAEKLEKQIKEEQIFRKPENLNILTKIFSLQGKKTRDLETIEKEIEEIKNKKDENPRVLETMLQGLEIEKNRKFQKDFLEYEAELNILSLGDIFIITVPGEFYSYYQKEILNKNPNVLFIGYSNGYIGYVTEQDHEKPVSYEEASAHILAAEGQKILEFIKTKI